MSSDWDYFEKCNFDIKALKFLGEVLSKEGIEPDPDKVKLIKEWEAPHDVNSLQSFFGILNFVHTQYG